MGQNESCSFSNIKTNKKVTRANVAGSTNDLQWGSTGQFKTLTVLYEFYE